MLRTERRSVCSDSSVKRPVNGEQSRLDRRGPIFQPFRTRKRLGSLMRGHPNDLLLPAPTRSPATQPSLPSEPVCNRRGGCCGEEIGRVAPWRRQTDLGIFDNSSHPFCTLSSPDRDREFMRSEGRLWGCILASLRVCDRGRCEVPLIVKLLIRASSKLSTFRRFWFKSPSLHCARSAWRWGGIPDLRMRCPPCSSRSCSSTRVGTGDPCTREHGIQADFTRICTLQLL